MMNNKFCRTVLALLLLSAPAIAQSSKASKARDINVVTGLPLHRQYSRIKPPSPEGMANAATAKLFTFTTIDYPGACETFLQGTSKGMSVGFMSIDPTMPALSFIYKSSKYSLLTVPGAQLVQASSVNSLGQIVGTFEDASGVDHGFIDDGESFTQVDYPDALSTVLADMNANGDMTGHWVDADSNIHGFISQSGVFTSFDFPGSVRTLPVGINATDEIVGIFANADSVNHGFSWKNGVFTQIDAILSTSTILFGVSDSGEIAGSYRDAAGNTHGLLYAKGVFNTVDVPGAALTELFHISSTTGTFAGIFHDQLGAAHGFTGH